MGRVVRNASSLIGKEVYDRYRKRRIVVYGAFFSGDLSYVTNIAVKEKGHDGQGEVEYHIDPEPGSERQYRIYGHENASPIRAEQMIGMSFASKDNNHVVKRGENGNIWLASTFNPSYRDQELGEDSLWGNLAMFCEWAGVKPHEIPAEPAKAFETIDFWRHRYLYFVNMKGAEQLALDAQQRLNFLLGRDGV